MPRRISKVNLLHAAVVVAVTVIGQAEAWTVDRQDSPREVVALCALAATGSLALVRMAPDVAAAVVVAALVVKDLFNGPGELIVLLLCGVVTAFAVGLRLSPRRARIALTALLALAALGVLVGPEKLPELAFSTIALGAPWFAGTLVRSSREHARVLEELVVLREKEAEDRALLAAAEERNSIAREIHDLVGHSVSLMVLQAGAADEVLSRSPDAAKEALGAIQDTGRLALADLHSVLGLLRADGLPRAAAGPVPGLQQLDALLSALQRTGLDVEFEITGDVSELPASISLTAYRIIQEGLTNVVRHAEASKVQVSVDAGHGALSVQVVDDGHGGRPVRPEGHGLLGIRERVAMYDGEFSAGPRSTGGFRLRARLPVGGSP